METRRLYERIRILGEVNIFFLILSFLNLVTVIFSIFIKQSKNHFNTDLLYTFQD
jgi:hypothetical protein